MVQSPPLLSQHDDDVNRIPCPRLLAVYAHDTHAHTHCPTLPPPVRLPRHALKTPTPCHHAPKTPTPCHHAPKTPTPCHHALKTPTPCHHTASLAEWLRRPLPERKIPGFESRLRRDFFSGLSHTSDFKIGTPRLPCQAPGIIGSALGLVGPVSVFCD